MTLPLITEKFNELFQVKNVIMMFKLNFCISTPKFHLFRITIFFYAFIIKKWIDTKFGEYINTKMIFLRRKLNVNTNSLPVPKIYRQIQTFERKRVIFRERLKLLPSKVFTKLYIR